MTTITTATERINLLRQIPDDIWIDKVREKIALINACFSGFGSIELEVRHGKVDYVVVEAREKIE